MATVAHFSKDLTVEQAFKTHAGARRVFARVHQPALEVGDTVRLPDEIRAKIPQLATVPEFGKVTDLAAGAYTVEFGEVRLQGLAEDFIKADGAVVA
jgi:hypothetical protein